MATEASIPKNMSREPPPAYQPLDPAGSPYQSTTTPASVVVITHARPTVIITNSQLPDMPTRIRCPSCHDNIVTSVTHTPATKTHLWALVLCLIGCWPCCLVPYCVDSCQNSNHFCPSCGTYLGTSVD